MSTLYGIPNCDTVRRARRLLEQAGIEHRFHDLRRDGLDAETVQRWLDAVGDDALINRRGTTWRGLSAAQREQAHEDPVGCLLAHPTLIRRPVIEHRGALRVGLAKGEDQALLAWLAG